MSVSGDVIVVGGGHNGLVAAGYLARAGMNVLVLERRSILGGACVTEELCPGFHFSSASFLLYAMRPKIVRDMQLRRLRLVNQMASLERVGQIGGQRLDRPFAE